MNVPNDRIGFSKLPENVQQRMDPSLANKYQMGGSVMQRPLFRQMGGPTDMMPQDMMPPPPMGGAPMAPPPMDPAMEAQLMEAENMGAQTGEQIGAQFSQDMMMNLEGAEDYQSLIDGIRGNQLPIDARYQELAGYVGEQDAMATPESVLALTQPTIMMTEEGAMDSGIGELMQGIASDVPMQGPMDEGVGALMAAGAGNTPPVNFRNGGPVEVRGYAGKLPGSSDVRPGGGSRIMAQAERDVSDYEKYFSGGLDQEARAAALAEQNEMAKAQMLFDIAGTALNFAGNTQGNTIAERLASAASQTQLTDKIGARSAGILTAKQAQASEERQLRMAARDASLNQAQTDEATRATIAAASAKEGGEKSIKGVPISIWKTLDKATQDRLLYGKEGTVNGVPLSIYTKLPASEKRVILGVQAKEANNIKGVPTDVFNKLSVSDQNRLLLGDPQGVNGVPRDIYDNLSDTEKKNVLGTTDGPVKGIPAKVFDALSDTQKSQVLLGDPQGVNGIPMSIYEGLSDTEKKSVLGLAKDVKGIPMSIYETLNTNQKERVLLGDPQGINGVPRDIYNKLSAMAKKKVLGISDDPIKGLPREVFDKLSVKDQNRFILGDPQGVKGIPRDIYDALSADAQALIVDPAAQSALEVEVKKAQEDREAKRPYTKVINNRLVRIDPAKPENEQITVLTDLSDAESVFGNSPRAKAATIVSNEGLLAKYATGTLDKTVDGLSAAEMETAFQIYTGPVSKTYNEALKRDVITPGLPLNQAQIKALQDRKAMGDLSLPTGVYFPADDIEQEANKLLGTSTERTDIPLADQLKVPSNVAFGSVAFLKNLGNIGLEVLQLPAIFDETKNAADAVKSLNQEFETIYLAAQEIRDSVFQGKKLENLTPDPVKFFTGPDASRSKALILYKRLVREITRIENSIENPEVFLTETGTGSVGTKRERLPKLRDLRDGYALLAKIDMAARGLDPEDVERSQRQLQLIRDLNEASGIIED